MKKVMIAVSVIAFVAVTQAASINWGGAISDPTGTYELSDGTMAYLVWSDTSFTGAGASFDGTSLTKDSATIATMVSSHSITASEATNWEFMETYTKAGSDVNGYYTVLISDNGSPAKYSYYDLAQVSGTTASSPTTSRVVTWADAPTGLATSGYVVQGVPEPTSGLLILLGMAGLALRRRRA